MGTIGIRKDYLEEKALNAYPDISYPCDKPSIYEDPRFTQAQREAYIKGYCESVDDNEEAIREHDFVGMTAKERTELYKKALHDWGIGPQTMMVMEETGEMLNAMGKYDRGRVNEDEVITELVDVWILMEQMAVFFGWNKFQKEKERKLERLKERLNKGYTLDDSKKKKLEYIVEDDRDGDSDNYVRYLIKNPKTGEIIRRGIYEYQLQNVLESLPIIYED